VHVALFGGAADQFARRRDGMSNTLAVTAYARSVLLCSPLSHKETPGPAQKPAPHSNVRALICIDLPLCT